jgi:hypothetical protein
VHFNFITSWGDKSTSRPGHFIPWETATVPIEYEVGWPQSPFGYCGGEIFYSCRESNLDSYVVQLEAIHRTD